MILFAVRLTWCAEILTLRDKPEYRGKIVNEPVPVPEPDLVPNSYSVPKILCGFLTSLKLLDVSKILPQFVQQGV